MDINASRISLCTPNDFAVLHPAAERQISAIRRIAVMDELGCVISAERLHILDCDRIFVLIFERLLNASFSYSFTEITLVIQT